MEGQQFISTFMDCVDAVHYELKKGSYQNISSQLKAISYFCVDESRISIKKFNIITKLAKGAYGEVYLASKDNKTFAIKKILKDTIMQQPFTALFMSEKQLMIDARDSEWLLYLHYTFQDEEAVYFVMDFLQGGDFMGYLVKKNVVTEEEIKFYGAEMVASLEELHNLGYIHRDLKPENLLIEKSGHIKLADFGSCIKTTNGKVKCSSTVGTPDYVSPDILCGTGCEVEYGYEVDLWALGVVLYEMLYEMPPFYSDTLQETYERITNIDFAFPNLGSKEFKDLVSKLLCRKEQRLTIGQIKKHAFFAGIDWSNLKKSHPPFKPDLEDDVDLSNFEIIESSSSIATEKDAEKKFGVHFLNFVGFSFDPDYSKLLFDRLFKSSEFLDKDSKKSYSLNFSRLEGSKNIPFIEEGFIFVNTYPNKIIENKQAQPKICTTEIHVYKNIHLNINTLEHTKVGVSKQYKESFSQEPKATDGNQCQDKLLPCILTETVEANTIKHLGKKILFVKNLLYNLSKNFKSLKKFAQDLKSLNESLCLDLKVSKSHNDSLINSLNNISLENKQLKDREKSFNLQFYKKELRIKRTEVKEFQQKLENEIIAKNKMENEIIFLKKEVARLSKNRCIIERNFRFKVKILGNLKTTVSEISFEDQNLRILDSLYNINNIFIRSLKNNELFHMGYKERSLAIQITIVNEISMSSTSNARTNLKMLEDAIKKEENIQRGIEKIMKTSSKLVMEDANNQLEGSKKRLSYLHNELEKARNSTDVVYEDYEENEYLYEYNNHSFKIKTFTSQTFCDYCNDVLRGVKDQGLSCKCCNMIVHRNCYVLTDISCELYEAMNKGTKYYILMRSIEDKNRFLKLINP